MERGETDGDLGNLVSLIIFHVLRRNGPYGSNYYAVSFDSSDLVNLPFWWRLRSALAVSTFPTSNTSSTTTCPAISKNTSTELEEPGVSEISVRSYSNDLEARIRFQAGFAS